MTARPLPPYDLLIGGKRLRFLRKGGYTLYRAYRFPHFLDPVSFHLTLKGALRAREIETQIRDEFFAEGEPSLAA